MPESISQAVGGKIAGSTAEFTRPANATAYTAGDVVSNSTSATTLIKFSSIVGAAGGSGYIVKAKIETDLKTEVAQYRLILYAVPETARSVGSPTVTPPLDNAADTVLYVDRTYRIGYIDFPACSSGADTTNNTAAQAQWTGSPLAFRCYQGTPGASPNDAPDNAIYGKLINMTGTTPASGQKFSLTLSADQNS